MSKRSRAKKWANENPDAVMAIAGAVTTVGFILWIRHAIKNAESYPVAYGFDLIQDNKTLLVHKLFEDDTVKTLTFVRNPLI